MEMVVGKHLSALLDYTADLEGAVLLASVQDAVDARAPRRASAQEANARELYHLASVEAVEGPRPAHVRVKAVLETLVGDEVGGALGLVVDRMIREIGPIRARVVINEVFDGVIGASAALAPPR